MVWLTDPKIKHIELNTSVCSKNKSTSDKSQQQLKYLRDFNQEGDDGGRSDNKSLICVFVLIYGAAGT